MNKEDAKKWVALRHYIFLGATVNVGAWEFEDNLHMYGEWEKH